MLGFINNLLVSKQYIPHGHCYLWQPELLWLHILADALIALSYFSIPLTLIFFIRGREDVPFKGIFILFSLFIFSCGTTHVMSIWTLWYPSYWLSGLIKAITAIISLLTAFEMVPTLPKALALRSPKELEIVNQSLEVEIANRQQAEVSLQELNTQLESIVEQRTQEYKESEKRLQLALEASEQGLWDWDISTGEVYFSPRWQQMLDYNNNELISNLNTWEDLIHPDDKPWVMEKLNVHLKDPANSYDFDYRLQRKDGDWKWVANFGKVVDFDQDGKPSRMVGLHTDISDRKLNEEILKQTNQELLQSNQELEKFAYLASHDLREPLRMVTSFTQLLAQRYSGKLDADADQIIGFAVDGASRMEELIHDLLEYSCIGKTDKSWELVNFEAVLDRALNNLQVSIRESNVEIIHTQLPVILGDQGQLIQLWQNLIDNAIVYRQQEPFIVEIRVEEQQDHWLFSIKDNGIGIAPPYQKRIFQIFQRLHTKQEYPGTGIGLAICHKIVQRHGGKIWVESELGMGATFYFTLPTTNIS